MCNQDQSASSTANSALQETNDFTARYAIERGGRFVLAIRSAGPLPGRSGWVVCLS